MYSRTVALAAVALCAAAALVGAQERASAEEILGFFPYGSYSEVEHIDSAAMARGEAYPQYLEFLANSPFGSDEPVLPPSLAGQFYSWTTGQLMRMKSKKISDFNIVVGDEKPKTDKDVEEVSEDEEKEPSTKLPEGTQISVMQNVGDLLGVYRFEALDLLIEEALKNGEIEPTGYAIDERPIYSFRAPGEGEGEERVRYAYAMPTGEFLTAERIRNLGAMVEAGMGRDMNILDDEDFVRILAMLPDLGQKWRAVCTAAEMKMIAERMRRSGEDEERAKRMEDWAERGARLHVETTLIGEQITEREYEVYGDEDYAKELFENGQTTEAFVGNEFPEEVYKHQDNLKAAQKKELLDNMIVTTIVYDRKLLESAKAFNDAMREVAGDSSSGGKPTIVVIDQSK